MKTGYVIKALGLLGVVLAVLSCEKEVEKYDEVVLDPITIGQSMESAVFEIEVPMDYVSNEWFVNSPTADTWLTHEIIPSTKSMWVMLDGNVSGIVRSSYIQIRCKGKMQKIIVNQDCAPVLVLGRSTANFKYQGGTQTVKVSNFTDVKDIEFELSDTWCTAQLTDDSIVLTASENPVETRREATLTVKAKRAISGVEVSAAVSLSQDKFGQKPSYEYSVDGGQTWIEDIPATFSELAVRTNNGVKISSVDVLAYKTAIDSQTAPASLDLSAAEYETNAFPTDIFAGTAVKPNTTLKMIRFPKNVTSVGDAAFTYCLALETVDLTGIKVLGKETFRYSGLKTLYIPETLESYGTYVFADNESLTSVYYNSPFDPGSDKTYNMYTFYIDKTEVENPCLTVTIGPNVKYTPRTIFRHNNSLVKLICEGPVYFRQYAFPYCENLAVIEFHCADEAKVTSTSYFNIVSPWDESHTKAGARVPESQRKVLVPAGMVETYAETSPVQRLTAVGYTVEELK